MSLENKYYGHSVCHECEEKGVPVAKPINSKEQYLVVKVHSVRLKAKYKDVIKSLFLRLEFR